MSLIIPVEDEPEIVILVSDVLQMGGHEVKAFPEVDST